MPEPDIAISAETDDAAAPRKKSRAPLLLALILFLAAAGGGFYASASGLVALPGAIAGLLPGGKGGHDAPHGGEGHADAAPADHDAPVYVPVEQLVVPLGPNATAEFLVIETEIEADAADAEAFEHLRPRIRDVFNTFLRAVDERDIEEPSATLRLRAQLLRRVRAVSGPATPRDLLITTFILK